jgi:hypothetical protein
MGPTPIAIGADPVDVLTLGVTAGSQGYLSSSGTITATGPSRLIAIGEALVVNAGPVNSDIRCRLSVTGSDTRPLGNYVNALVQSGFYTSIPVSGGIDVDAGTYDVHVQCYETSGSSNQFHRGNLTVTISPR